MTKRRVIGLDFDDVLMDFHTGLCEFHNQEYGTSFERKNDVPIELEAIWGCTRDEANQRVMNFYNSELHKATLPVVGGPEAVRKLCQTHDVVVVTSRPDAVRELTLDWLNRHYKDLIGHVRFTNQFMGVNVKQKKSDVCAELGVDVFIDDFLSHVTDIAESGREALLFDAPWNQAAELHPKITRVKDWEHILKILA